MDLEDPLVGIWENMPMTDGTAENLDWFSGLTHAQQVLLSTNSLSAEVYNGGFHQYFHNSSGLHAPEAVSGFRELGLDDVAELILEAMNVFGPEFPREQERRQQYLDAIAGDEPSEWNPFFLLDDRFYDIMKIPEMPPLHDEDRLSVAIKDFLARSSVN